MSTFSWINRFDCVISVPGKDSLVVHKIQQAIIWITEVIRQASYCANMAIYIFNAISEVNSTHNQLILACMHLNEHVCVRANCNGNSNDQSNKNQSYYCEHIINFHSSLSKNDGLFSLSLSLPQLTQALGTKPIGNFDHSIEYDWAEFHSNSDVAVTVQLKLRSISKTRKKQTENWPQKSGIQCVVSESVFELL